MTNKEALTLINGQYKLYRQDKILKVVKVASSIIVPQFLESGITIPLNGYSDGSSMAMSIGGHITVGVMGLFAYLLFLKTYMMKIFY